MDFEILATERLNLRKITPEVYTYVFENYAEKEIKEFFGFAAEEAFNKELKKYKEGVSTFNRKFFYFQLIDKLTPKAIGWCGFHTWYIYHYRAEIGYVLEDDNYKGKGIMTEAVKAIIDYGFSKMDLNRIEAFVGSDNIPSLKIIKNAGFKQEAILKEHYYTNNMIEDSLLFALLKNEYYSSSNAVK